LVETEAAPIRDVAELLGVETDSERALRRPLMVLSDDPPAIALTAATSARPRAFDCWLPILPKIVESLT
jgi:hypothetical protein